MDPTQQALQLVEGPIFRFAFLILILGVARAAILFLSDLVGARLTAPDGEAFWHRVKMRFLWSLFPAPLLARLRPDVHAGWQLYHAVLSLLFLVTVAGAVVLPLFLGAHVELWKQTLGLGWPALPGGIADAFAITAIVAGFLVFLLRLYSPVVRQVEPGWSFLKPLVLILPFVTGYLAMHPTMTPLSYSFVRLLHVISAEVAMILVPFGALLSTMHRPVMQVFPEAAWQPAPHATGINSVQEAESHALRHTT